MAINYDDKRFQEVENQEATALKETKGTYDKMINNSESYYQQQINASKEWANKQSELQQAQTDFTIEKVNQAKDQAKKDYTKEQKGAYVDYQKATNQYGANAETLASQGLQNSGYAESTMTSMYNTYQNRYTSARESYTQAILNYDNSIKEAQLANNSALATIAYEALQKQLELSLQGFQYKNQLVLQKLEAVNQTKDRYYQRWQNVQSQINTENAMAEQIRQYNESMAEQIRQYNESMAFQKQQAAQEQARWEKEYALAKSKASSSGSSGGSGGSSSSKKGTVTDTSKKDNVKEDTKNNITQEDIDNAKSQNVPSPEYISTYKRALTLSNMSTPKRSGQELAADFLKTAYDNKRISASDVRKMTKQLGLD